MNLSFFAKSCAVAFFVVESFWVLISSIEPGSRSSIPSRLIFMVLYLIVTLVIGTWRTGEAWNKMGKGRKLLIAVFTLPGIFMTIGLAILLAAVGLALGASTPGRTRTFDRREGFFGEKKFVERGVHGKVLTERQNIFGSAQIHERDKNIFDEL